MGKSAQYSGMPRSGGRPFSETLEDFSSKGHGPVAGMEDADAAADPPEDVPPPEPVITLHPDELERLKAEARQEGYRAGEQAAEEALATQMAGAVQQVLAFMEKEDTRRDAQLAHMSSLFVDGVCQSVEQLLEGDLVHTTLRKDLAAEVAALSRQCRTPLSLTCAEADEPALRAALGDVKDLSLHVSPQGKPGHLTLKAEGVDMVLDGARWAEAVRKHVAAAIQALAHPPQERDGIAAAPEPPHASQSGQQTTEQEEADHGRGSGK